MGKLLKALKKRWITVWLVTAAAAFLIITAYAVYTRVTVVKRVVSTQAGMSSLFSSDHMSAGGMRSVESVSDDSENVTVTVNVYNYIYPKEAVYRTAETQYDLTAKIGTLDSSDRFTELSGAAAVGSYTYSITNNGNNDTFAFGSGTSHTFEGCTIDGDGANQNTFTLVFDKIELSENPNGFCMMLEAEPYDSDLPKLHGYVSVRLAKTASSGWKGELEEIVTSKQDDYDGYNYYLEGNGAGQLTFRWNRNFVTISKDFLNNKEIEFVGYSGGAVPDEAALADSDGMVALTVKVDSSVQNRYEIQFFKVDPEQDYSASAVAAYLPPTDADDWVADS